MKPVGALPQVALAGVQRARDDFEKVATELPRQFIVDSVTLTGQSRDIPQAMVDMRVAKYAFVANLKVLQTADDMAREVVELKR
ncbi:MAG: flagellar basal body rod C-terminal domain-containing protein [Polyangiaceae bacterium]